MSRPIIALSDFRIPDYPSVPLTLNGQPLRIFAEDTPTTSNENSEDQGQGQAAIICSTIPIGIATILYRWHPNALAAFLDFDAWFSLTWHMSIKSPSPSNDQKKFEIGRVNNQITFGTLDSEGINWDIMLTYNVITEGPRRGQWVPNLNESMIGDVDIESEGDLAKLSKEWVEEVVGGKRWEAGKGVKPSFHVEYAPMDIFGDGIAMSPHWLYAVPNTSICATCQRSEAEVKANGGSWNRCAGCGTAAYCSRECQKNDWKVHKWVCNMSVEDRGMALKVSENGGLIGWDRSKELIGQGDPEVVESGNPHFETPQLKRRRDQRMHVTMV